MTFRQPYSVAWGGTQADAHAAGPGAKVVSHGPSSAQLVQAQWDDTEIPDEQFCISTSSKTQAQCRAYPVKGEQHCTFHLRRILRERESADDGADA